MTCGLLADEVEYLLQDEELDAIHAIDFAVRYIFSLRLPGIDPDDYPNAILNPMDDFPLDERLERAAIAVACLLISGGARFEKLYENAISAYIENVQAEIENIS